MTPQEKRSPPEVIQPAADQVLLKPIIVTAIITAIITVAITTLLNKATDRITAEPWQALVLIIPLVLVAAVIYLRLARGYQLTVSWSYLIFLSIYLLAFFVAAQTSVLDWKRSPVGYEKTAPRNPFALNRFDDWHYVVAPEEPPDKDLAIVLMKPDTPQNRRSQIADLIAIAKNSAAKGIGLDFYFLRYKENKKPEEKGIDDLLCGEITDARTSDAQHRGLPIFAVYDFDLNGSRLDRREIDPDIARCLPLSEQGHGIGFAETDGLVRSIPLYFQNDQTLESFSLKIAKTLNNQLQVPDNRLLQFIKPDSDFETIEFDKLENGDRSILRDRFILVGEESGQDTVETPYGTTTGVLVHAYAIHSLRHNHFVNRAAGWSVLLMMAPVCYLLTYLAFHGYQWLSLTLISLLASFAMLTICALTMLWLVWIHPLYPLLAMWIFLLLLIVLRWIIQKRSPAITTTVVP